MTIYCIRLKQIICSLLEGWDTAYVTAKPLSLLVKVVVVVVCAFRVKKIQFDTPSGDSQIFNWAPLRAPGDPTKNR